MEFRILGPVEVLAEGHTVRLGGSKQRGLLALLLLHANETLSTDRLIEELWGEQPPATAAKTVQVHVSRLRKLLATAGGARSAGDAMIMTREHGYELRVDLERLDRHRFEQLIAQGTSELAMARPERAADALERALGLWRGAPLGDLAYEPFARREIARLDELRVTALEQLIDAKLALGAHAEVLNALETLIEEHPIASGSTRSSCSPCTAASDRPTRCRSIRKRGGRSSTRSASSRVSACASSSARSSRKIPGSRWRRCRHRPRLVESTGSPR
jgi:DNA-binding SARP family transcriptional activator